MKVIASRFTLAIGLAVATWQSPALADSRATALFDEHVAAGLPQAFSLPRTADDERGAGIDQVVVEDRLETDVIYPDGSHAATYTGTANGHEAMFTRIGDQLAVSVSDEKPTIASFGLPLRRSALPEPDDTIPSTAILTTPERADRAQGPAGHTLQFWIFLHDKSGETNFAKFHSWYIAWWARDMEQTVKPGIPMKVFIMARIPGVTDFDYHRGTVSQSLLDFRNVANDYLYKRGIYSSGLIKSMLFVGERAASWNDYGYAIPEDTVAMASGTGPRHIIAHEFGHTLDAVHELGEVRFEYGLCVTNMRGYTPGMYSCGKYTKGNDARIREFVKRELERYADD